MASWRELSGRFAEKKLFDSLDQRVLDFIRNLPGNQPLLVACSGGADSVYLTLSLFSGLEKASGRLHLLHFNHGVRGQEADQDADFVKDLAKGLGIPCHLGCPDAPLLEDEASLREARYSWMEEIYKELNAGGLCMGHHADDVIESLLMAVLTGSGPAGLASPMPVNRFSDGHVRLRPMLSLRREQILESLGAEDIPWREDASNLNTDYTRNWLRLKCIPNLRNRIPQDIYSGTQRTRELMQECLTSLDESIDNLGIEITHKEEFEATSLFGQSRALIRRAFMSWWLRNHSGEILKKGSIDAIVGLVQEGKTGKSVDISKGQAIYLDLQGKLRLQLLKSGNSRSWSSGGHWHWPAGPLFTPPGGQLMAREVSWSGDDERPYEQADPHTTAWINWEGRTCFVRQWQAGDRYRPLGAPGSRKLQDIFVDAKLSPEQKQNLPVLLDMEGSILWVPGFPPAEGCRVVKESKLALKLTYIPQ